ncbi:hypothetical protein BS78_09G005500 [Paspalum vaginatum]|nr:hypothetical protein BS78_09G005500 [Paspalum vaginatum]
MHTVSLLTVTIGNKQLNIEDSTITSHRAWSESSTITGSSRHGGESSPAPTGLAAGVRSPRRQITIRVVGSAAASHDRHHERGARRPSGEGGEAEGEEAAGGASTPGRVRGRPWQQAAASRGALHRLRSQAGGHLLQQLFVLLPRPRPRRGVAHWSHEIYRHHLGGDTVEVDSVGLNILSVKIACSDIGFPIQVYGTVVARDSIDYKRVYLFRRDSDHPQLISSKKEGLILTGPKRALVLSDGDYIETDLWVKDDQGHCREFSKGLLTIPGSAWQNLHGSRRRVVGTESLATRLSTVDVRYEAVQYAVEATIAVEVLQGEFRGLIVAHTSGSKKRMLTLYDSSKVADGGGVIQLMRPALSVCVEEDELIILAKTAGGEHYKGLKFPSRVYRGDVGVFTLGDVVIRVNVNWSIMDP